MKIEIAKDREGKEEGDAPRCAPLRWHSIGKRRWNLGQRRPLGLRAARGGAALLSGPSGRGTGILL